LRRIDSSPRSHPSVQMCPFLSMLLNH
jgi:hypothetical protein